MTRSDDGTSGVQLIHRAALILNALNGAPNGMSLAEIAERTGLARSTAHRLVSAMTREGLLAMVSRSGRYRPGPTIAALADSEAGAFALEFHPLMARMSRTINETVDLAILEYDHVRFVHQITATHRLRAVSSVGAVFPAHCTANGKALLAQLPREQLLQLLPERLDQFTESTITDRNQLLAQLEQIRERGVAIDSEEHTLGICAIGIALTDVDGRSAAISVPMPVQRFAGNEAELSKALLLVRQEFETARR